MPWYIHNIGEWKLAKPLMDPVFWRYNKKHHLCWRRHVYASKKRLRWHINAFFDLKTDQISVNLGMISAIHKFLKKWHVALMRYQFFSIVINIVCFRYRCEGWTNINLRKTRKWYAKQMSPDTWSSLRKNSFFWWRIFFLAECIKILQPV